MFEDETREILRILGPIFPRESSNISSLLSKLKHGEKNKNVIKDISHVMEEYIPEFKVTKKNIEDLDKIIEDWKKFPDLDWW